MDIVDTHCHIHEILVPQVNDLTHDKWQKAGIIDADAVIADAAAARVTQLICVGTDVDDSVAAVDFVQSRPTAWASIGIHPHEAQRYVTQTAELERLMALAARPKVVAMGECGLDYFYSHSPKTDQITILRWQIELALQHNLPLIFHVREAFGDFWPVFDSYNKGGVTLRGVIHSFSASRRELGAIIERGLYVGVNGIATFTKDPAQLEAYQAVPLDRLVIETDAPYLTPTPYRGKICEPKHAATTLSFVATLQGKSTLPGSNDLPELISKIAAQTTQNARRLFNLAN